MTLGIADSLEIIVGPTGSGISAHSTNEQICRRQGTHGQDNRAHSQPRTRQGMGLHLLDGCGSRTFTRMGSKKNIGIVRPILTTRCQRCGSGSQGHIPKIGKHYVRGAEEMEHKPGDIVDGKEIEQDGDITWTQEDHVESEGIS